MFSNDTIFLTSKGLKKASDLIVGDDLLSVKGCRVKITGFGDAQPCMKSISFSSGDTFNCSYDAIIPYVRSKYSQVNYVCYLQESTEDMYACPIEPINERAFIKVSNTDEHELYRRGYKLENIVLEDVFRTISLRKTLICGVAESPKIDLTDNRLKVVSKDEKLINSIKLISRSLSYNVKCYKSGKGEYLLYVKFNDRPGLLPFRIINRINYKQYRPIIKITEIKDAKLVLGRKIYLERNVPVLAGIGLIPVCVS